MRASKTGGREKLDGEQNERGSTTGGGTMGGGAQRGDGT